MTSIPTSLDLLKSSCSHIDNALTEDLKLAHKSSESILGLFEILFNFKIHHSFSKKKKKKKKKKEILLRKIYGRYILIKFKFK